MSTIIDEKVVSMRFDNQQFQNGAKDTISTLDKLKAALDRDVTGQNFDNLEKAARNVDLSSLAAGVEALSDRFSTLGIVGMTVIQNITNALMNKVGSAINYAMDKIVQGGINRAMNIENARFQLQGLIDEEKGGAEEVQAIMDQASESVNGTAYAYDSAAKAASMFAATGMKSGPELEKALKAVAGVAATTNSDYESMSQIFTTVAGQGRVMADQLNQLASRGLNAAAALKDYFNAVAFNGKEASDSVKEQITAMAESITMTEEQAAARKEALQDELEMEQEAAEKEYKAKKKALDKQYEAVKETYDKEYNLKKKELDKQYEALSKSIDKEIEAVQKSNEKQLEEAQKSYEAQVEAYRKATEERISLIDKEYLENLKLIDEEKYNRLKAIDDEIQAINDEEEAEEKARQKSEREEKLAELNKAIETAKSTEARETAEKNLADYKAKIAQEDLKEQRKAAIESLKEQKEEIKEEADLKKEAAKEKRDTAIAEVKEESSATLKQMQETHNEEIKALRESQSEQIQALKESKKERLEVYREAQNEELNQFRKAQNEELEIYRESQNDQLEEFKRAQNKKLAAIKESINKEIKAVSAGSGALEMTEADIRDLVSKGKVSFEIFSEAMASTFGDHAKDANRTFTGAMANIGAALARIGEMFVRPLIEQEGPMVKLFNQIRLKINDIKKSLEPLAASVTERVKTVIETITSTIEKLEFAKHYKVWNKATQEWGEEFLSAGKIMKDFFKIIEIGKNVFNGFISILKPIKEAFMEVFNPKGFDASGLLDYLVDLSKKMILTDDGSEKLKNVFVSIFETVKQLANGIAFLVTHLSSLAGIIFDVVKSGGSIIFDFFKGIIDSISKFIDKSKETSVFTVIIDNIKEKLSKLNDILVQFLENNSFEKTAEKIKGFFKKVSDSIESLLGETTIFGKIFRKALDILGNVKDAAVQFITSIDPIKTFFSLLNGALLTGVIANIKKITKLTKQAVKTLNIKNITINIQALPRSLEAVFMSLRKSLDSLSKSLNAKAVKDIAMSMLMLSGALLILSTIDGDALGRSLIALSVGLGELTAILYALVKFTEKGTKKTLGDSINSFISAGKVSTLVDTLIKISVALLILSIAVKNLSTLDWQGVAKGLTGVTVLLGELVGVVFILDKIGGPKKLTSVGAGLALIAVAVNIMISAVKNLGAISIDELLKGLGAVGVLLLEMAGFAKLAGGSKKLISIGMGMVEIAIALKMLAGTISDIGSLDTNTILKGIAAIGGLLLELSVFTKLAGGSKKMISIGVGMILLAQAIKMLTTPMTELAALSWDSILRGLGAIGGLLTEITIAVNLMPKSTILKAAGLIVLAESLKILSDVLISLKDLSWEEIAKGLTAIGLSLAEITVALNFMPATGALKAAGLVVLAEGLKTLTTVLYRVSTLNWEQLAIGLTGLGVALTEVTVALNFMPATGALKAAGLVVLAEGLKTVAGVLIVVSALNWEQLAIGLTAIGGALAELTVAINFIPLTAAIKAAGIVVLAQALVTLADVMTTLSALSWKGVAVGLTSIGVALAELVVAANFAGGSLLGAATLFILAEVIKVLAPAFVELSKLSWEQVGIALTAMGGALTVLGGVAALLGTVAPFALAGALTLVAVGAALASASENLSVASVAIVSAINQINTIDAEDFQNGIDKISDAITKIGKALKNFGILAPLGASALGKTAEAIGQLVRPMQAFTKMKPERLSADFNILSKAIEKFGKALKSFGLLSGIGAKSLLTVAEAINKLAIPMAIFQGLNTPKLSKDFETLGDAFKKFGESLRSFGLLSGIGASAMLKIAEAISKLAPAMFILQKVNPAVMAVDLAVLAGAFKIFGESLDSFGLLDTIKTDAIVDISDAVSELAPALVTLSHVPGDKLSGIITVLGDAFVSFGEALDATPFWGPAERAEGIGALIDNITKLAEVLPPFLELDQDDAKKALETLGTAFQDFGAALTATPFWGSTMRAEGIGALIDNIGSLTEALPPFMELDAIKAQNALRVLGRGFKWFGEALDAAPFWGVKDRGEAIKTLVGSINTLSSGLKNFLTIDEDKDTIKEALRTIGQGFRIFGNSLKSAPFINPEDRGAAIQTLCNSIKMLATGLKEFMDLEKAYGADNLKTALETIGEAFQAFGEAVSNAPLFNAKERSMSIGYLVQKIQDLATGIQMICDIEDDRAVEVLNSLGPAFKDFGDAIHNSPLFKTESRTKAIGSIVGYISDLVEPLAALSEIGIDVLGPVLTSLTTLFFNLGTSVEVFSWDDEKVKQFGYLVNSIKSFSIIDTGKLFNAINEVQRLMKTTNDMTNINFTGINYFTKALSDLAKNGVKAFVKAFNDTDLINKTINDFINNIIIKINSSEILFNAPAIVTVSAYLAGFIGQASVLLISTTIALFAKLIISAIKATIASFTLSGISTAEGFLKGFIDSRVKNETETTVESFLKNILSDIEKKISPFKDMGKQASEKFSNGISSARGVNDATRTLVKAVEDGLRGIQDKMRIAGHNAVKGFTDGIHERIRDVESAGRSLGNAAYEAAKRSLDEHSPSKKMQQVGDFAGKGFINGLKDWVTTAMSVGADLGDSATEGLNNAINSINDTIQNGTDFSPVITPILDLDNLQSEANRIGGILDLSTPIQLANSASISFSGGISKMFDDLEASIPENSNDDVVEAINDLNTNMTNVMQTLGRLQVVLDTGTMVGELVNPMDIALNHNATMGRRGVR